MSEPLYQYVPGLAGAKSTDPQVDAELKRMQDVPASKTSFSLLPEAQRKAAKDAGIPVTSTLYVVSTEINGEKLNIYVEGLKIVGAEKDPKATGGQFMAIGGAKDITAFLTALHGGNTPAGMGAVGAGLDAGGKKPAGPAPGPGGAPVVAKFQPAAPAPAAETEEAPGGKPGIITMPKLDDPDFYAKMPKAMAAANAFFKDQKAGESKVVYGTEKKGALYTLQEDGAYKVDVTGGYKWKHHEVTAEANRLTKLMISSTAKDSPETKKFMPRVEGGFLTYLDQETDKNDSKIWAKNCREYAKVLEKCGREGYVAKVEAAITAREEKLDIKLPDEKAAALRVTDTKAAAAGIKPQDLERAREIFASLGDGLKFNPNAPAPLAPGSGQGKLQIKSPDGNFIG